MEENTSVNNPDETPAESTEPEAPQAPEATEAAAATPSPVRLRDQVWSFRSMLAVGIASLLLGGAGGAGIVAATEGHGHGDRFSRFSFGPDGQRGPRFNRQGGGGFNGGPGGFYPPVAPQNGQTGPSSVPTPSTPAG